MIVKNEHKELAENIFEGTNVIIRTDGAKHLGAVIGTSDYKETFKKKSSEPVDERAPWVDKTS